LAVKNTLNELNRLESLVSFYIVKFISFDSVEQASIPFNECKKKVMKKMKKSTLQSALAAVGNEWREDLKN
jgi:hypothetical protein